MSRPLSGWGRYPKIAPETLARPRSDAAVAEAMAKGPLIARGNGRSYGDSALSEGQVLDMTAFRHILSFDPQTGLVEAEAGVLLGDLIAAFLPLGFFPFVTPGTKLVTLGGAIAADVHGKNHLRDGSFGHHVAWIEIMTAEGEVLRCTRASNSGLFQQTIGGMGLTGVILRAGLTLRPVETGWIAQDMRPARDLAEAMAIFEEAAADADGPTYSVAWFDCLGQGAALGRSLVMLGDHARLEQLTPRRRARPFVTPEKRRLNVPLDAPGFALNRYTLRAFNGLYYRAGARKAGPSLVDWDSYFYPLDAIANWNRIYGRRGFAQFQCVLPLAEARPGLEELLAAISEAGQGSFLAVLKRLGPDTTAHSFPMEGYTLALDFPVTPAALALLDRLDKITLDHGGRFYLAKDSRLTAQTLHATLAETRRSEGWDARFASAQSRRLQL
ncbi:MAG: FAD-binding oxidoreductase [Rhodobacteraceae bacterium]|nr:FAD-binding oxidoreductase [Paracoccaceae bacterium]